MADSNFIVQKQTFLDDNGREWVMSRIAIMELKELETFMKTEAIRAVNSVEGLSKEDRQYLLDKAYDDISKLKVGSKAFDAAMGTLSSVSHLFYLSVRQHHKDATKATIEGLVTLANISELISKLAILMGLPDPNPPKAGAEA